MLIQKAVAGILDKYKRKIHTHNMNIPYKMRARIAFFCFHTFWGCSLACLVFVFWSCNKQGSNVKPIDFKVIQITYPRSHKDTTLMDAASGSDPYRWLENNKDKRIRGWLSEQYSITNQYFDHIPYRQVIARRMAILNDYQRLGLPKSGGKYYWWEVSNAPGHKTIYSAQESRSKGQIVLNTNVLSRYFNHNITEWAPSPDGTLLALASPTKIRIWDTGKRRMLSDSIAGYDIHNIRWLRDGFYYCASTGKVAAAHNFQQVFFHRPGTGSHVDELIYADRSEGGRQLGINISPDSAWMILTSTHADSSLMSVYAKDLHNISGDFMPLAEKTSSRFDFAGSIDGALLFVLHTDTSNSKIVSINPSNPNPQFWKTVVPPTANLILDAFQVQNKIMAIYNVDAQEEVHVFDLNGLLLKSVAIPQGMAVTGSCPGRDGDFFMLLGSFTQPDCLAHFNASATDIEIIRQSKCDFDSERYTSTYYEVQAPDGARIPVYIAHRRGLATLKDRPVLLTAYGAMGAVLQPSFDMTGCPLPALVLENGGIFVVACVRGGGERDRAWHQSATGVHKLTSFTDLQLVIEYLTEKGITQPGKMAFWGQDQGALLGGISLSQSPELFKAAILMDGPQDMLRYHLYYPGKNWVGEYGHPESSVGIHDFLKSYSPVHNIVPAKYPATLLVSGSGQGPEAAPAWHTYKMTATLQEVQQGLAPVLWYPASEKNKTQRAADAFAFLWYNLQQNVIYPLH